MIKAKRDPHFIKLFHVYNLKLLKKSFHNISITRNSFHPDMIPPSAIMIINHSSWWDPLILFYLNEVWLKKQGIAMMGEAGLKRFPFFRKLGAYSINADNRRDIITSLLYTVDQMDQGSNVFIFPQGKETHLEERPIRFQAGTAYLNSKRPDIPVVPVVFYHHLFHHQRPEWFIHIGEPVDLSSITDKKKKTQILEDRMTMLLDDLKDQVRYEKKENFLILLKGKPGIGESLEAVKQTLRRLTR